jgi:hypothetical protein
MSNHVSFSNRFWVSILDNPHRVYRLRQNIFVYCLWIFFKYSTIQPQAERSKKQHRERLKGNVYAPLRGIYENLKNIKTQNEQEYRNTAGTPLLGRGRPDLSN